MEPQKIEDDGENPSALLVPFIDTPRVHCIGNGNIIKTHFSLYITLEVLINGPELCGRSCLSEVLQTLLKKHVTMTQIAVISSDAIAIERRDVMQLAGGMNRKNR